MQCFKIMASELEGRIDPIFYANNSLNIGKQSNFRKVKLGDFLEYAKSGFAAGKAEQANDDEAGSIIQIRPTNVSEEGELYFDKNIYISKDTLKKRHNDILQKGEVLFNNTNSQEWVGKTAFFNLDGVYFASNHITRLKTTSELLPEYLRILLNIYQKNKVFFNICTNWNNQSGVNSGLLKELVIPLPDLPTQQKIIEKFDSAQIAVKAKEQEAVALLASIDEFVLSELGITLPEAKPKTCFTIMASEVEGGRFDTYYYTPEFILNEKAIGKGKYKSVVFEDIITDLKNGVEIRKYAETGFRYLRVTDLTKNGISDNSPRFVYVDRIPERVRLSKDDFLISRSGSLGLVSCVDNHIIDSILSSHIFKVTLNKEKINSHFLEAFLRSKLGQLQFRHKNNGGIIPEINQSALKSIKIPLPPLAIQQKIAGEVQSRMAKAQQLKREATDQLTTAKQQVEAMILGKDAK